MKKVNDFLEKYNIENTVVFAAVSGGKDSMCLLHALLESAEQFSVSVRALHFNHGIRGENADRDEAFVREACEKLGVPIVCGRGSAPEYAEENGLGIEEAARELRYRFFENAAAEEPGSFVATAHSADDNAETVIMNIARGAGGRGAAGIPPVRGIYIRPLITALRSEIEDYNEKNNIENVEDETNSLDEYTRNYVRLHILPEIRKINPEAVKNICNTSEILRMDEDFIKLSAEKFVSENTADGKIDRRALGRAHPALASAALRILCPGISFAQTESVLNLCRRYGENGQISLSGKIARADFDYMYFGRAENARRFAVSVDGPGDYETPEYSFSVRVGAFGEDIEKRFTNLVFKYCEDCGKIVVRSRETGDKIKLSGKAGTKSLKKLFIEKKIPSCGRDAVPVVEIGGFVAGVAGFGADVKYRPGPGDKVYIFTFREKKI